MKFTCTVEVNKEINKVIELWEDEANFNKWQDGFISMEHLSGTPGTPGAKSKILYQAGKRTIELIETIKSRNLPHEFVGTYAAKEMTNTMRVQFKELDANKTLYTSEIEYTEFNGFMPKLMAWLMPGMFEKQTQKWLDQFKSFAESQE